MIDWNSAQARELMNTETMKELLQHLKDAREAIHASLYLASGEDRSSTWLRENLNEAECIIYQNCLSAVERWIYDDELKAKAEA